MHTIDVCLYYPRGYLLITNGERCFHNKDAFTFTKWTILCGWQWDNMSIMCLLIEIPCSVWPKTLTVNLIMRKPSTKQGNWPEPFQNERKEKKRREKHPRAVLDKRRIKKHENQVNCVTFNDLDWKGLMEDFQGTTQETGIWEHR